MHRQHYRLAVGVNLSAVNHKCLGLSALGAGKIPCSGAAMQNLRASPA